MGTLDRTIFYKLEQAIRTYRQFAQREIRKAGFAITIDQWLLLTTINEKPGVPQIEIADAVFKDNASVTRIIELLVKAGYLKRKTNAGDRRRSTLAVTRSGDAIIEKVGQVVRQNRKNALRGIDRKKLATADNFFAMVTENCKKQP
ncbi:MAG: MarR family winged helix-turn-helix transcriptional regulator [Pyrinomonadaceae bacterium]